MKLELNTPACIALCFICASFVTVIVLTAGGTDIIDMYKIRMVLEAESVKQPFCEVMTSPVE